MVPLNSADRSHSLRRNRPGAGDFLNTGIDRPRTAPYGPPSLAVRQRSQRSKSAGHLGHPCVKLASHRVLCQRQADPGDDRIPLAVLCSRVIHQDADEAAAQLLAVRFDEKINQEFHRAGLI